jgi:hypothetical protein
MLAKTVEFLKCPLCHSIICPRGTNNRAVLQYQPVLSGSLAKFAQQTAIVCLATHPDDKLCKNPCRERIVATAKEEETQQAILARRRVLLELWRNRPAAERDLKTDLSDSDQEALMHLQDATGCYAGKDAGLGAKQLPYSCFGPNDAYLIRHRTETCRYRTVQCPRCAQEMLPVDVEKVSRC